MQLLHNTKGTSTHVVFNRIWCGGKHPPQRLFAGPQENIMEKVVRVLPTHLMRIETLRDSD